MLYISYWFIVAACGKSWILESECTHPTSEIRHKMWQVDDISLLLASKKKPTKAICYYVQFCASHTLDKKKFWSFKPKNKIL